MNKLRRRKIYYFHVSIGFRSPCLFVRLKKNIRNSWRYPIGENARWQRNKPHECLMGLRLQGFRGFGEWGWDDAEAECSNGRYFLTFIVRLYRPGKMRPGNVTALIDSKRYPYSKWPDYSMHKYTLYGIYLYAAPQRTTTVIPHPSYPRGTLSRQFCCVLFRSLFFSVCTTSHCMW